MADEQNCSICCSLLASNLGVSPNCGHVFHMNCLQEWLKMKSLCPLCKKTCTFSQIIPLQYEPQSLINDFVDEHGKTKLNSLQRQLMQQVFLVRTQQRCAKASENLLALQQEINDQDKEIETLSALLQEQEESNYAMEKTLSEHNEKELQPVQEALREKILLQSQLQNDYTLLLNHMLLIRSLNNLQDELEGKKPPSSVKRLAADFAKFKDSRGLIITWQTRFLKKKLVELSKASATEQEQVQKQLDELGRRAGRLRKEKVQLQELMDALARDLATCEAETSRWDRKTRKRLEEAEKSDPTLEASADDPLAQLISFVDTS